jgi:hypothetical protein
MEGSKLGSCGEDELFVEIATGTPESRGDEPQAQEEEGPIGNLSSLIPGAILRGPRGR